MTLNSLGEIDYLSCRVLRKRLQENFLELMPQLLVQAEFDSPEAALHLVDVPLSKMNEFKVPLLHARFLGFERREYINILLFGKDIRVSRLLWQSLQEFYTKREENLQVLLPGKEGAALLKKDLMNNTLIDLDKALDIVCVLWLHLYSHWGDKIKKLENWKVLCLESLIQTTIYWFFVVREERWVEEIKYGTNYLFAKFFEQELPEKIYSASLPGTLFVGKLNSHFRKWFGSKRGRSFYDSFRFSVLNGCKRGMPDLPEEEVEATLKKHSAALSLNVQTPEQILEEVERTALEVFGGHVQYMDPTRYSNNGCTEAPKSHYGSFSHFLSLCERLPKVSKGGTLQDKDCIAKHCLAFGNLFSMTEERSFYEKINFDDLVEANYDLLRHFDPLTEGTVDATVILEPLKARIITVASVKRNACLQGVQRQMIDHLRRFRCFDLTNKPFKEALLQRLPMGGYFVSADYSSATDLLHLDATLRVAQTLTSDPELYQYMKESLCAERISYPEEIGYRVPGPIRQTNGQLMGCMVSFPILCVINAAICRSAFERFYRVPYKLDEVPMMINGDDLLFTTPDLGLVGYWERMIKAVGFKKSVGKNFVSTEFATVNSTFLRPTPTGLSMVPSLKMGKLVGYESAQRVFDRRVSYQDRLKLLKGSFSQIVSPIPSQKKRKDSRTYKMCERAQKICLRREDVSFSHYPPSHLGLWALKDRRKNVDYIIKRREIELGSFVEEGWREKHERDSKKWTTLVPDVALNSKCHWIEGTPSEELHPDDAYNVILRIAQQRGILPQPLLAGLFLKKERSINDLWGGSINKHTCWLEGSWIN